MKKIFYSLGAVQVFIAIGAIPAATLFLIDTSGRLMGTTTEMLADSPFRTYLIPALYLLVINGLGNATGAFLSFAKRKQAGLAGFFLGGSMVFWIGFQVAWIGLTSFLQPLFFVTGLVELILSIIIMRKSSSI
ncbi:MAG: hypothetical protein U0X39_08430 [Bacteroidales bacterium]